MLALYLSAALAYIPLGAMYSLQATGLVLVYRTTGVFNFAQAAIGLWAAYLAAFLREHIHGGYAGALLCALLGVAAAAGIGVLIEFTSVRRARGSLQRTIVTLGWLLVLQSLVVAVFTSRSGRLPDKLFSSAHLFTVPYTQNSFGLDQVLTVVIAGAVVIGLARFLARSSFGVSMRAVADDPEAARLLGLPVSRVLTSTWALGGAVSGLAGVLIAPLIGALDTFSLFVLTVEAIAAAMVGRLVSLPWAFAGGFLVAVLQDLAVTRFRGESGIDVLVVFLVVMAAVLLRRRGGRGDVGSGGLKPAHVPALPGLRRALPWAALVVAVVAVLPLLLGTTKADTLAELGAWAIAALSIVLLTGVAGQVSVCQCVFMGIGAFLTADVMGWGVPFLLAVPIGALGAGAAATVVGIPALRLEPLELAIVTVALAFAADGFLFGWHPLVGGNHQHYLRPGFAPGVGAHKLRGDRLYDYLVLGVFLLAALGVAFLRRSRTGAALTALRSSEAATSAMGFSVVRTKLAGFAAAGVLAGLAGGLFAGVAGGVSGGQTSAFQTSQSITLLAYAVIAGVASVPASLLAGLLVVLPELTVKSGLANDHVTGSINALSGLVLVFFVVVAPDGVVSLGRRFSGWLTPAPVDLALAGD